MAYINQLNIIALTDHNTCKNCEALLPAAERYNILAICGMELSTAEDIHVLCFFPDLDRAMAFDAYVETQMNPVPNDISFFGNQLLYAPGDQLIGEYPWRLQPPTRIPFSDVADLVASYGGVHVPAHLERPSHSLIHILGGVPEYSCFSMYEINDRNKAAAIRAANPYLEGLRCLHDSDAHSLEAVKFEGMPISLAERSFEAIFGL